MERDGIDQIKKDTSDLYYYKKKSCYKHTPLTNTTLLKRIHTSFDKNTSLSHME
jgi:hypothetical protein